jgi:ATP-binding protein involved in chromosome partitioning
MFNFLKRRRLLKALQSLNSAVLEEKFASFLKMIKFEKSRASLLFETRPEEKTKVESFEKEVKNLGILAGFKEKALSVIVSSLAPSTPKPAVNSPVVKPLSGVKNVICIASCKGGVGKSTVAINLAKDYAEKGLRVGLLDADIYGPSIPIMLQIDDVKPQIREGKMVPIIKDGISVASMGFMVKNEDALMWRGAMVTKALKSLFEGVLWEELDILVVDLPPGTGDVYISLLTSYEISGVLMVSSPHIVSLEEMKKTIQLFKKFDIKTLGLVENMIENGKSSSDSQFKAERQEFQKEGFVRLNLNFAKKIPLN